jgi:hypothetical protein
MSTSTTPLLPKSQSPSEPRLIDYHESLRTVPWQTDNEYILSGYRRQLHSIRACLWSAIACERVSARANADHRDAHADDHDHDVCRRLAQRDW